MIIQKIYLIKEQLNWIFFKEHGKGYRQFRSIVKIYIYYHWARNYDSQKNRALIWNLNSNTTYKFCEKSQQLRAICVTTGCNNENDGAIQSLLKLDFSEPCTKGPAKRLIFASVMMLDYKNVVCMWRLCEKFTFRCFFIRCIRLVCM